MSVSNEIILRPRFKITLEQNHEHVLRNFESSKATQKDFIISRIDDHVFIKMPKEKQHFWSPELHLEINEIDENRSMLHGLFGPKPSVWTMFMFFHFIVAGVFITFGIWAYSNWSLETEYIFQIFIAILMVVIWIGLYLAGRLGKATGKDQMLLLYNFMNKILNT